MEKEDSTEKDITDSPPAKKVGGDTLVDKEQQGDPPTEMKSLDVSTEGLKLDDGNGKGEVVNKMDGSSDLVSNGQGGKIGDGLGQDDLDESRHLESKAREEMLDIDRSPDILVQKTDKKKDLESKAEGKSLDNDIVQGESVNKMDEGRKLESGAQEKKSLTDGAVVDSGKKTDASGDLASNSQNETDQTTGEILGEEKEQEPVFDGTEDPGMEVSRSTSTRSLDNDSETQKVVEKAVALKNLVTEKGAVVVSSFLRRLSGKKDDVEEDVPDNADNNVSDSTKNCESDNASQKTAERSTWNPLNYISFSRDGNTENKDEERLEVAEEPPKLIVMKGRIILYTRLGCQDCKEARSFLHMKRLGYVEINIDIYPSRKQELEKIARSTAVPKVFFNEVLIGGLGELRGLDESGKLDEKIEYLITEAPSFEAPLPPLSGEDDVSSSGAIDELALVVRKMKESIIIKDRFYKMRRFTNCFLGSEAVDFLSEDQLLEREEVSLYLYFLV